jgi:hypothetical protein
MTDSRTPSPAQRAHLRSIAALGGLARSAKYDGVEMTAAARSTYRASFIDRVDPDRVLPEAERLRRAEAARRLHFARMAYESAKARRANGKARKAAPKLSPSDFGSVGVERPESVDATHGPTDSGASEVG